MLPALEGRINRKTYITGNLVGLGLLGLFCAIIVIPVAILDLALGNSRIAPVLDVMYFGVLLPVLLYAFYFSVLLVKRAHDLGLPGLLWVAGFFSLQVLARLTDFYLLNIASVFIILFFCLKAGTKGRNNYGPQPRRVIRLRDLKVTF